MAVSGPLADIPGDDGHDVFVLETVFPGLATDRLFPTQTEYSGIYVTQEALAYNLIQRPRMKSRVLARTTTGYMEGLP